jgi:hypothetical protein
MLSTIKTLLARASEHLPLRILVQPVDLAVLADAALVVVTMLPRECLLVPPVGPLPGNVLVVSISPADWAILEQALIAHRTCVACGHHRPSTRTRAGHQVAALSPAAARRALVEVAGIEQCCVLLTVMLATRLGEDRPAQPISTLSTALVK